MGELSSVAAIVDTYGGFRVVVTQEWRFGFHLSPGEMLFVVPNFKVNEPVKWHAIPYVIKRAQKEVERFIKTRNDPELPEVLKLYQLRQSRTYQRETVNLHDICET